VVDGAPAVRKLKDKAASTQPVEADALRKAWKTLRKKPLRVFHPSPRARKAPPAPLALRTAAPPRTFPQAPTGPATGA